MSRWSARADGAHEWTHDLCGEGTVFAKGLDPNKPWRRCPACMGDMGSWIDAGAAGSGNKSRAQR